MNRTIKTLAGAAVLVSAVSLVPAFSVSALTLSTDTETTGATVQIDGAGPEYKIPGITLAEGASLEATTQNSIVKILTLTLTGNATLENINLNAPTGEYNGVTYGMINLVVSNGATLTLKNGVENANSNSLKNTNGGTIVVDGTVTYQTANAGKVKVTKNGNLTLEASMGGLDATSIEIDAEIAADGTVTSGNVTVPSSYNAALAAKTSLGTVNGAGVTSGAYIAPVINTTTDTFTVDAGAVTEINVNIVDANGASTLVKTLNNKVTTFGEIRDDIIAAIKTAEGEDYRVGKILVGSTEVADTNVITTHVTYSYEEFVFAATVVVTDTTGATSNVRSLEVTEEGKTIQDILTANSITISDEYGFYTTADGSTEINLTDTIAHGASIEVFIVAKPDEAPETPASINATLYFINGTDDVISGVSFGTNYYVTTPGILSSILSEKGISLAGRYALFTRNSDGTFTKVNLDSESIATDGSYTYYVGLEDGTVLTDSYYIYVSNKTWEEIEGFGDYDYVSRSTKNKNLSVADLINKYGKIFDSTKHSIFAYDYKTKKYVKIDGAMSISELYAKYSNDVILAKKDSKTAGALVSSAALNTADVDLKDVLNDEVLNNKANGFTKDEIKEIKDAVENDAAEIYASAYQFTPTAADKKKIEEAAKKEGIDLDNIIGYLDVNVTVWTGENSYEIHETGEELEFSARINTKNLPEVAKGKTRAYYVIRNHNGEISFIKATLAKDGKTLRFKSDKFSTYAVAYVDLADIVLAGATTNKTPDTAGFINNEKSVQSTSLISVITAGVIALGAVIAKLFKKSER